MLACVHACVCVCVCARMCVFVYKHEHLPPLRRASRGRAQPRLRWGGVLCLHVCAHVCVCVYISMNACHCCPGQAVAEHNAA